MWTNDDGLTIKFGTEEAANAKGGEINTSDMHTLVFTVDYTDALSATAAVLGGADGSFGVVVPEGAVPVAMDVFVKEAFTSSGTIGSATLVVGTKKASDRSTELDHDGLTTSSFVGSVLDAKGELTTVKVGVTGAGDDYGTAAAENGVICVANSAHATNPFTAGKAECRLHFVYA